jgi:hypothetical protein
LLEEHPTGLFPCWYPAQPQWSAAAAIPSFCFGHGRQRQSPQFSRRAAHQQTIAVVDVFRNTAQPLCLWAFLLYRTSTTARHSLNLPCAWRTDQSPEQVKSVRSSHGNRESLLIGQPSEISGEASISCSDGRKTSPFPFCRIRPMGAADSEPANRGAARPEVICGTGQNHMMAFIHNDCSGTAITASQVSIHGQASAPRRFAPRSFWPRLY